MRIGVVAHSAVRAGGVETYLAGVIPALAGRNHDVGTWFESTVAGMAPVSPAVAPRWVAASDLRDPLGPLRAWRPDVVYLHGLRSDALERQLLDLAPVVFFAHSYYGACISGEKSIRFPAPSPCDRRFGPACLAHYMTRGCGGLSPLTMVRQYAGQKRKENLLRDYELVLVASRHMAAQYAAQGIDARVLALPASDRQSSTGRAGARRGWNLLYLGRLERSKGVDVALRSCAAAARTLDVPIRLVVAGDGSRAAGLRREAADLIAACPQLSVEFVGWLSEGVRDEALQDADLLLVPSIWPEPFGLVGVEAGSAGVPAIAFDVGGIGEWLSDGANGRLVAPEAPLSTSFADAIVDVLSRPDRLDTMKLEAVRLSGRFTMAAHVAALESLLAEAAGRRAPHSA
jgi:glycosyltransferase involved in cell wall biosynthesis